MEFFNNLARGVEGLFRDGNDELIFFIITFFILFSGEKTRFNVLENNYILIILIVFLFIFLLCDNVRKEDEQLEEYDTDQAASK